MPKGGSIVLVQTTGAKRAKQKKQGKEGDIVTYLLPRAKVRPISKYKQIKTSNTQSWFDSNHHTDSLRIGVLEQSSHALFHDSCGLLGLPQVSLHLLYLFDETIQVEPEDSSTTSHM